MQKYNKQQGFTIVELLVVIVVIGILAAITIVSYTGVTAQANTTASKTAAKNVIDAANMYYAEKGVYPSLSDIKGYTTTRLTGVSYSSSFVGSAAMILVNNQGYTASSPSQVVFAECRKSDNSIYNIFVSFFDYSLKKWADTPSSGLMSLGSYSTIEDASFAFGNPYNCKVVN
jgi:prepilin-type N-terminal cleavage/methylation domain-containing protein